MKNDRICLWQHWRGTFKPNAARGGEAESQDRNTVPCPVIGRGWCRLFSRIPPSWSRVVCQSSRQFSGTPPPIPAQVPIRVPSATRGAGSRGVQELENRAGSGRDRSVGGGWRNYDLPGCHGYGVRIQRHLPRLLQDVSNHHHVRGEFNSAIDCVSAAICRRWSALVGGVSTTSATHARSPCARLVAIFEHLRGLFLPRPARTVWILRSQLSPVS